MHIEDRFEQAAAIVAVFRMQHRFPLAEIGPQFRFRSKFGRRKKTGGRGVNCLSLALAAVGPESNAPVSYTHLDVYKRQM